MDGDGVFILAVVLLVHSITYHTRTDILSSIIWNLAHYSGFISAPRYPIHSTCSRFDGHRLDWQSHDRRRDTHSSSRSRIRWRYLYVVFCESNLLARVRVSNRYLLPLERGEICTISRHPSISLQEKTKHSSSNRGVHAWFGMSCTSLISSESIHAKDIDILLGNLLPPTVFPIRQWIITSQIRPLHPPVRDLALNLQCTCRSPHQIYRPLSSPNLRWSVPYGSRFQSPNPS